MASGLTATGLVIELIDDIRSGMQDDLRQTFYASLLVGDSDPLGHIVGLIANDLGLLWERLEQVNSSQDPDKATGQALDALAALTGTFRQSATKSKVIETLCGDPGTTIAAGWIVQTVSTQSNFDSIATVVTVALTAWAGTTSYTVDQRVTNAARCYQCTGSGTSASSGGPTTTSSAITDGTVTWEYIGEGTAAVDVEVDCEVTGPVQATAGDLTAIQTPISGLKSARNLVDATLGTNLSTDEELRLIRQIELAGNGATTKDALRAAMLKVLNVISCTVFVNNTDATDNNGLPPHSFETLVLGGLDQDVVNTIAQEMPAGIQTYGSSSGTYTDTQGNPVPIKFTRPTDINVYVDITVQYDATKYPSDGDAEIKTAIVTWAQGYFVTDQDVNPSFVGAQAFSIGGVLGVPQVLIYSDVINGSPSAWAPTTSYVATVGARSVVTNDGGRVYICTTGGTSAGSGGPTGTGTAIVDGGVTWYYLGNILSIALRQLAVLDSTRITVHSSAITP